MNTSTGSDPARQEALAYLLGGDVLWNARLRPESVMSSSKLFAHYPAAVAVSVSVSARQRV